MSEALRVKSTLLCDSIRREDNGKLLLIGVYPGDILFASYPATFSGYILSLITASVDGPTPCQLKIEIGDSVVNSATVDLVFARGREEYIGLPVMFAAESPGMVVISIKVSSYDWQELLRIPASTIPSTNA